MSALPNPEPGCGRLLHMRGTVVLLPGLTRPGWAVDTWPERRAIAAELAAYGIPVLLPSQPGPIPRDIGRQEADSHWVAHIAIEVSRRSPEPPLLLVAQGDAGARMRALGFSQRASRHAIAGYVLIDATLPDTGHHDWPDAPVDVVMTPSADQAVRKAARIAELRGWTCHRELDAAAVIRHIMRD